MRHALVAQLDRVTGYEPVGRGFESLPARQIKANRFLRFAFIFLFKPGRDSNTSVLVETSFISLVPAFVFSESSRKCAHCAVPPLPKSFACANLLGAHHAKHAGFWEDRPGDGSIPSTGPSSAPRRRGLYIVRDGFFISGQSRLSLIPSLLLSPKSFACANLSGGPMKAQHRFCVHLFFEKDSNTSILVGTSFLSLVPAFLFFCIKPPEPARHTPQQK